MAKSVSPDAISLIQSILNLNSSAALKSSGRQADATPEVLQVLDIALRELPTHRYIPVGQSFHDPGRRQPLGEGLESWHGFYQSIRPTQTGLSLNIDMSSTAFLEPLPVIDFVTMLLNRDLSARSLSDSDRVKIKKALRGVQVEVTHRGNMHYAVLTVVLDETGRARVVHGTCGSPFLRAK